MPIPAPGNTAAVTAGGVEVKVGVIVGVVVSVLVTVDVTVGVDVGVCVAVDVDVAVGVNVDVNVGGSVCVGRGVFFLGTSVGQGGNGFPAESKPPQAACASTRDIGGKNSERNTIPNRTSGIFNFMFSCRSLRVDLPAKFGQFSFIKLFFRDINMHGSTFGQQFICFSVIYAAPGFSDLALAPAGFGNDLQ
jgi:hypothetical protein